MRVLKSVRMLLAVLWLFTFAPFAGAQTDTPPIVDDVDSRRAAQYLLGLPEWHIRGVQDYCIQVQGYIVDCDFSEFRMERDGKVTWLRTEGGVQVDVSQGDLPLGGLPRIMVPPGGTIRYFYLHLDLWDQPERKQLARGTFEQDPFDQGTGVLVKLEFAEITTFISFGSPLDPELERSKILIDGEETLYDKYLGGAFVSVDPVREVSYVILGPDGTPLRTGVIDLLRPQTQQVDTMPVGFSFPGGVMSMEVECNEQVRLLAQRLDGVTYFETTQCPSGNCQPEEMSAWTRGIELGGDCLSIYGLSTSGHSFGLLIERWHATGELDELSKMPESGYPNGYVCGEDKIVVTIFQQKLPPAVVVPIFDLYLYRYRQR